MRHRKTGRGGPSELQFCRNSLSFANSDISDFRTNPSLLLKKTSRVPFARVKRGVGSDLVDAPAKCASKGREVIRSIERNPTSRVRRVLKVI